MKIKNNVRSWQILWILLGLIVLSFSQCKKEAVKQEGEYDASKPIVITDFYPKEGGGGNNLIIYGDNFGNDLSRIRVTIGGKVAKVIGIKSNSLYCIIPEKAYEGDISIAIIDDQDQEIAMTVSQDSFSYNRKLLVSTFLGKYYQVSTDFQEKEGPFNDCGAFKGIMWLSFDPKNHNHLYFTADGNSSRMIDFENEYVSYFRTGFDRTSIISWKADGDQDMIVADNHSSDTKYF